MTIGTTPGDVRLNSLMAMPPSCCFGVAFTHSPSDVGKRLMSISVLEPSVSGKFSDG